MGARWFFTCPTCNHRYGWEGEAHAIPPCPQCLKARQVALQPPGAAKKTVRIGAPPTMTDEAEEALALCDEIESLAGDVPEAGETFAGSVCERTADIRATIERTGRVSPGQLSALENMRDGLSRWIR
jgi:hypothetical protein